MTPKIYEAASKHALELFPEEAVGFVVKGKYLPQKNVAPDPSTHVEGDKNCPCRRCRFETAPDAWLAAGKVEMVIHSHPDGPFYPSEADMVGQMATNVPWAIIATDGERAAQPTIWGDSLPIPAIIGRQFMHGVTDCYSLIRDTFRLGKDALAAQDVTKTWPYDPITLPEVPRSDGWWADGKDLYVDHFEKFGFRRIEMSDARPGDIFFATIPPFNDKMSHGGMMIDHDLILHHLPSRLSRREPAGIWGRHARFWIRHESGFDADA